MTPHAMHINSVHYFCDRIYKMQTFLLQLLYTNIIKTVQLKLAFALKKKKKVFQVAVESTKDKLLTARYVTGWRYGCYTSHILQTINSELCATVLYLSYGYWKMERLPVGKVTEQLPCLPASTLEHFASWAGQLLTNKCSMGKIIQFI